MFFLGKKKRGSLFFHKWGRRLLVAKEKKRSPTLALTGISKCSDCVAGLLDRDWYGTFCEWFILLFYLKHPLFLSHLTKSQITSLTNFILGKFNIPKMSLHSHPQLQNWTHPVFRTLVKGGSSRSSLRLPNISKPIPHVLKRQAFPGSLHAGCPRLSSRRLSQALSLLSLAHFFSIFKICEFLGWLFSSELKLVNQMPQNFFHRIFLIFLFCLAAAGLHKLYCKANETERRRKTEKKEWARGDSWQAGKHELDLTGAELTKGIRAGIEEGQRNRTEGQTWQL